MIIRASLLFLCLSLILCVKWASAAEGATESLHGPGADAKTLRHTTSGDVVGFLGQDETYEWRGIPYAQPPIGNLRWRAPRRAKPWVGVRRALEFGSSCLQLGGMEELVLALYGG